jgi:hypothetical protein
VLAGTTDDETVGHEGVLLGRRGRRGVSSRQLEG